MASAPAEETGWKPMLPSAAPTEAWPYFPLGFQELYLRSALMFAITIVFMRPGEACAGRGELLGIR